MQQLSTYEFGVVLPSSRFKTRPVGSRCTAPPGALKHPKPFSPWPPHRRGHSKNTLMTEPGIPYRIIRACYCITGLRILPSESSSGQRAGQPRLWGWSETGCRDWADCMGHRSRVPRHWARVPGQVNMTGEPGAGGRDARCAMEAECTSFMVEQLLRHPCHAPRARQGKAGLT